MKSKQQYLIYMLLIFSMAACEKDKNEIPIACFSLEAQEFFENNTIAFTNCSENATAYYWEFGDGNTSIDFHATHVYQETGTYVVSLSVFNGEEMDKTEQEIHVQEDPMPIACFTVPSSNVLVGQDVPFTNCSQKAESYFWDFGDGNTSTEEHPVHVFYEAGEMLVILTVENEFGEDSMSQTINVAGTDVLFFDGFEDYEDFSLSFGDWTQIDNDGSPTWGLAATSFPNSGYVGSFIIFNPSQTDPPVDDDERFIPYNGQKYAACFAARNSANDDWLISPEIHLDEGFELSLAAKSYSDSYGPDLFVVQLLDQEEVIWLSPENDPINPSLDWTLYDYDLTAHAGKTVRIQIGCLSDDAVALFIDDITVRDINGNKLMYQNFETNSSWQQPFSSKGYRE